MIFFSLAMLIASGCRMNRLVNQDKRHTLEASGSPEQYNASASGDTALSKDRMRSSCQGLSPYKIVGGQTAIDKTQITAATLKLIIRNQKYCSATLIGKQHIVTAAHCLMGIKNPSDVTIGTGLEGRILDDLEVEDIEIHPLYKGVIADDQGYLNQPIHDVAAVTFRGQLPPNLIPVAIAQPYEVQAGMPVIVSGYGAYASNDKIRRPLSFVETTLSQMETALLELQIFSGDGRGACFGDSGGPTFIVDSTSSCLLLIGSTTGPGRNTDYSCESGGGTIMDLTRYRSWLACAFRNLDQPLDTLAASVATAVSCDSK
jgi:hypothetical protein